jgi:hypothetical protein
MDYMFLIKSEGYDKVILDCQSFINGLNLFKNDEKKVFTLPSYGHCISIHKQILTNVKEESPSCIKINSELGEIAVINESCRSN